MCRKYLKENILLVLFLYFVNLEISGLEVKGNLQVKQFIPPQTQKDIKKQKQKPACLDDWLGSAEGSLSLCDYLREDII